jgi:hypothetical protein
VKIRLASLYFLSVDSARLTDAIAAGVGPKVEGWLVSSVGPKVAAGGRVGQHVHAHVDRCAGCC